MRMSYCPAAHLFLFLVQWTDCNLAGALGLLRILIYKVYADGTTTMSTHERKASIREFYAVIYPSLAQLHEGINELEDRKQKAICIERYRRREEDHKRVISEIDDNIEEECGICMEINNKVVLPTCSHAMCIKCYRDWRSRSQSCPFCRDSLKRVNSADLWIYTDNRDIVDMATVRRENLRRLFMYIDKLPTVIPESVFEIDTWVDAEMLVWGDIRMVEIKTKKRPTIVVSPGDSDQTAMARFTREHSEYVKAEKEFFLKRDVEQKKKEDEADPSTVIPIESLEED
ncbi:E3 ubiquitin-protein ligase RNF8-B-like [Hordeum vulgare]|nr:E3 ubiquitin-protein ligase RNF8-B-like [Hordeum vulgare]